jgi:hypothetical protein
MARTHEVPNHLNVQDTVFLELTERQAATLIAFASSAYGLWDQLTVAPVPVRGSLALIVLLLGIAFTLFQPGGRPLDEWAFAVFAFAVTPRRLRWRRLEPDQRDWSAGTPSGWADLSPRLGWHEDASDARQSGDHLHE